MTEPVDFETTFEHRLQAHARSATRPFDAVAVAQRTRPRTAERWVAPMARWRPLLLWLSAALLVVTMVGIGLMLGVGGRAPVIPAPDTDLRPFGVDHPGGLGVVDAFEPLIAVALPAGSYTATRTPDAIEVWASDERLGLLAWKDPQGFLDPCDQAVGRYDIGPSVDEFVAYFRQHRDFDVLAVREGSIDGRRSVNLVIQARTTDVCPSGSFAQWQPKAETSDRSWHLGPGGRDSLHLVEVDGHLVMLQVLPVDVAEERAVIDSVQFLDRLPG